MYVVNRARLTAARARTYPTLCDALGLLEADLARTRTALGDLIREREGRRVFELGDCWFFGAPFVAIRRKTGISLACGRRLAIVELTSASVLAMARVTEIRADVYVAKLAEGADALWLGNIRQAGSSYSAPPPASVAILLPNEESQDV